MRGIVNTFLIRNYIVINKEKQGTENYLSNQTNEYELENSINSCGYE